MKITDPVVDNVYGTYDYSKFKALQGNREINILHLDKLKASINELYLKTDIVVNEKLEIIDGQHRFEVIKESGLMLRYIVVEGYGADEVRRYNRNSRQWKIPDYTSAYISKGNENYRIFKEFHDKYGLGYNESIALLTGCKVIGGGHINKFKDGKLVVTHLSDAIQKAECIIALKPFHNDTKRRPFVLAVVESLNNPKFNFTEFMHKLKLHPTELKVCAKKDQYIDLIEKIYNYRRGKGQQVSLKYN